MIKRGLLLFAGLCLLISIPLAACQTGANPADNSKKSIVVTYSILGSIVKDLAGESVNVTVLMPNGADLHAWEPSAKDIETVNKADLIVQNGLALESGIQKTINQAGQRGVKIFSASDYVSIRQIEEKEGTSTGDHHLEAETEDEHHGLHDHEAAIGDEHSHHHEAGASDPHLWTDPVAMKNVVIALAKALKEDMGINVDVRSTDLQSRLDSLNKEIIDVVSALPSADRKLVTGHESMGYFAQRYGFQMIGAIIPSITSQAEVSAADLAELKELIQDNQVKAIFTEHGTSPAVARAIGDETGIKVIELNTHTLPEDGSYFTFERNLAKVIADGLK